MAEAKDAVTAAIGSGDIAARFEHAIAVVREAGRVAMDYYRRVDELVVESKANPLDVVSIADKEVEAVIRREIAAKFPDDGYLGEEMGIDRGKNDCLWVIDPIDGTACFVNKMPTWVISVALMVGNEAVIGLIYEPNGDELFAACIGKGATVNGKPIAASQVDNVNAGVMGVGMSHRVESAALVPFIADLLDREGMFIRNGSCALMMAYAASGRLIGYFEPHINPWDCMAGIVLMREAGGWCNGFLDAPNVLEDGAPILVAGPKVADVLSEMTGVK
ncbi:inositol monophosphatase family protein [Thalassospira marina]|uniref:Inositol monophosphatase n=1 Tax=Thalassospira marina TaxID=2048283 RepID=A0ABM6Q7J1_9PROT|nr:inositol monophosphatase [Thalassospira marina]AUG52108.1 inositol monophosphatase [Thalassospira marina]